MNTDPKPENSQKKTQAVSVLRSVLAMRFLDLTLKAKTMKAKVNKGTISNQTASAQQRRPSAELKGNLLNGRKHLQSHTLRG